MVSNAISAQGWIRPPKPNPAARLRLFCFPYAGAGASIFRTWPQMLPAEIEVCPVQLPGREGRIREPAYTQLAALTPVLLAAIRPYLDRPFALFGHSMGALIGYELAHALRQQEGLEPMHLVVSGRHAPHLSSRQSPVHSLDDVQFLDTLQQRYEGIPAAVFHDPELRSLFTPLLRADFTLVETYLPTSRPRLSCPMSAFGGLTDPMTTQEDMAAWRQHTEGAFTQQMFAGDHFYLQQAPAPLLRTLAQLLAPQLSGW